MWGERRGADYRNESEGKRGAARRGSDEVKRERERERERGRDNGSERVGTREARGRGGRERKRKRDSVVAFIRNPSVSLSALTLVYRIRAGEVTRATERTTQRERERGAW